MMERVQKLIAAAGICSRRAAEELITAQRVTVDGAVCVLGDRADAEKNEIRIDGKLVCFTEEKRYLMLNKPRGYVTTMADEKGRRTAAELVENCGTRVYPVGRLDMDSEGLLLFTNDGELTNRLLHPRFEADKTYQVRVTGDVESGARLLREMRDLGGEPIAPAAVRVLKKDDGGGLISVTIHEGKNRQVRRMCAQAGLSVKRLRRVAEHGVKLGSLPLGQWRELTEEELRMLGVK
ncbi:MAG: rRNA pseudouridine synthase [Oscillospiraceae bacterium]|nr:rRNA pseudouridine synthase [Oscillospiraceae bacterium]